MPYENVCGDILTAGGIPPNLASHPPLQTLSSGLTSLVFTAFNLDAHTMSSIFVKEPLAGWLFVLTQRLPAGSCLLNHAWPPALAHLILLLKKKKERERETQSPELWTPANLKRWIRREKLWLIWFGDEGKRKANADFSDSTIAGCKKYAQLADGGEEINLRGKHQGQKIEEHLSEPRKERLVRK